MSQDSHSPPQPARRTPCYNLQMLDKPRDRWDLALMIGGGLGLAFGLMGAALFATLGLVSLINGDASEALLPAIQATSLLAIGALGLPAIYWGAIGRRRRAVEHPWPAWIAALLLFPAALILGSLAFDQQLLPGLLGPLAHLLAAGAPVLFVTSIVLRRGGPLSARRRWGHFLAGLWGSPPLAILVELLALVPTGAVLIMLASISPETLARVRDLALGEFTDQAQLTQAATDLLSQPLVILVVIGYLSLLVPMIEEVLKTITVWPVLRRLTASQAFVCGALGGAGYALFESLFLAQPGGDWLPTMIARSGTPLIHAFNTGLVSLGLFAAFQRRQWLRLVALYLVAVTLHGLWNFLALGIGLTGFGVEPGPSLTAGPSTAALGLIGLIGLLGLAGVCLAGLIWLPDRLDHGSGQTQTATMD